MPMMKCLLGDEAEYVMRELHEGIYGRHIERRVLRVRVLRAGFFWLTREKDCIAFTQKCLAFQKHGNVFHTLVVELHNIVSPWPFAQ